MADQRDRTGVYDPGSDDLTDLTRSRERQVVLRVMSHSVGVLVATAAQPEGYDPGTQLVSVVLPVQQVIKNPEGPQTGNAAVTLVDPIIITNIPVAWPRKQNTHYLTFPLEVGDSGELHIQSRDITAWRENGQQGAPPTYRLHSPRDAVFHPTLYPGDVTLPSTDPDATVLEGTTIKLGRNAVEPVTLWEKLEAYLDANKLWQDGHIHPVGMAQSGPPTVSSPSVADAGSSKVLSE